MKNRYVPIIAFTLAVLLVGSVVYASDKRKKAKLILHEPNEMSEEALKVELLAASDDKPEKIPGTKSAGSSKSTAAETSKVKASKAIAD
jgi:hypothetical protein